jgi:hypothetical protein
MLCELSRHRRCICLFARGELAFGRGAGRNCLFDGSLITAQALACTSKSFGVDLRPPPACMNEGAKKRLQGKGRAATIRNHLCPTAYSPKQSSSPSPILLGNIPPTLQLLLASSRIALWPSTPIQPFPSGCDPRRAASPQLTAARHGWTLTLPDAARLYVLPATHTPHPMPPTNRYSQ